jgi:hypothetical protein
MPACVLHSFRHVCHCCRLFLGAVCTIATPPPPPIQHPLSSTLADCSSILSLIQFFRPIVLSLVLYRLSCPLMYNSSNCCQDKHAGFTPRNRSTVGPTRVHVKIYLSCIFVDTYICFRTFTEIPLSHTKFGFTFDCLE